MRRYNLKMRISRLELIQSYIDLDLIAMADGVDAIIYDHLMDVGLSEVSRQGGILGETIRVFRKDIEYIAKRRFHNSRSEEHTSELQSRGHLVCRLLLEKKNKKRKA